MNKVLFILLALFTSVIQAAEPRDLFKEFLVRNEPIDREMIILVCEKDKEWCNGYFTSVIHSLKSQNIPFCLPVNDVNRQIDKAVWTIIKSWLYRQPKDSEFTLSYAIHTALTEHSKCN
jgi:hypothetical protein